MPNISQISFVLTQIEWPVWTAEVALGLSLEDIPSVWHPADAQSFDNPNLPCANVKTVDEAGPTPEQREALDEMERLLGTASTLVTNLYVYDLFRWSMFDEPPFDVEAVSKRGLHLVGQAWTLAAMRRPDSPAGQAVVARLGRVPAERFDGGWWWVSNRHFKPEDVVEWLGDATPVPWALWPKLVAGSASVQDGPAVEPDDLLELAAIFGQHDWAWWPWGDDHSWYRHRNSRRERDQSALEPLPLDQRFHVLKAAGGREALLAEMLWRAGLVLEAVPDVKRRVLETQLLNWVTAVRKAAGVPETPRGRSPKRKNMALRDDLIRFVYSCVNTTKHARNHLAAQLESVAAWEDGDGEVKEATAVTITKYIADNKDILGL